MISNTSLKLFLCGGAALFWELVLIRWMGSSVRVVAYYINFILISAFFGLGTGALLFRYRICLWKGIFVVLAACLFLGPFVGNFFHLNPSSPDEFVWIGAPKGVLPQPSSEEFLGFKMNLILPYWLVLGSIYTINALLFLMFGQWLGRLFQELPPLKAYTIEIGGSILGIVLFAALSFLHLPPVGWFLVGFLILLLIIDVSMRDYLIALVCSSLVLLAVGPFANNFIWSPYYKIAISPLQEIHDTKQGESLLFKEPFGYALTVNNDYHQMMLDLRPRSREHPFFDSWRWLYDYPYHQGPGEPKGPILIVGAGTGNDVSAALRNTESIIDAVEIDPIILHLGQHYHVERPYHNPRVRVMVDDARSYFIKADRQYAKIVFGFLDSHTLMSSFSSVRLDNFVYTYDSMERVKELLLPGGKVYVTFASNTLWLHERIIKLLEAVFDYPTRYASDQNHRFANGIVYVNGKAPVTNSRPSKKIEAKNGGIELPTDDWPFLYMEKPGLPSHYTVFMIMVIFMAAGSLLLLPSGQRRIRLPYFFMGAGFFLIETSNVVSLSLLYGSTWIVNITVFTGILTLVLLGNLMCFLMSRPRYTLIFGLLFVNILVAYLTPPSSLLTIRSVLLQGLVAGLIFLGPVFFASLIFGHLIKSEKQLYQAYGSNLVGAVIGGSFEYFSLVMGIKLLLVLTFLFYALAFVFLKTGSARPVAALIYK